MVTPPEETIDDFNVMSKEMREKLLGEKETEGILDKGIKHLTDANTNIGAQIVRLELSEANLVTALDIPLHIH